MYFDKVKEAINEKTKLVFLQKSRGYAWRRSLTVDDIEEAVKFVKSIKKDVVVMVDNCYGEFVESKEPTEVGVDIYRQVPL